MRHIITLITFKINIIKNKINLHLFMTVTTITFIVMFL